MQYKQVKDYKQVTTKGTTQSLQCQLEAILVARFATCAAPLQSNTYGVCMYVGLHGCTYACMPVRVLCLWKAAETRPVSLACSAFTRTELCHSSFGRA